MPAPDFVKLNEDVNSSSLFDFASLWHIAGREVKPYPEDAEQADFVDAKLTDGVLVEATEEEYDEFIEDSASPPAAATMTVGQRIIIPSTTPGTDLASAPLVQGITVGEEEGLPEGSRSLAGLGHRKFETEFGEDTFLVACGHLELGVFSNIGGNDVRLSGRINATALPDEDNSLVFNSSGILASPLVSTDALATAKLLGLYPYFVVTHRELDERVPDATEADEGDPLADGTYTLKCVMDGGEATYAWVLDA